MKKLPLFSGLYDNGKVYFGVDLSMVQESENHQWLFKISKLYAKPSSNVS